LKHNDGFYVLNFSVNLDMNGGLMTTESTTGAHKVRQHVLYIGCNECHDSAPGAAQVAERLLISWIGV